MLMPHSDVIANHVEQCETSANKEDIRKDGIYCKNKTGFSNFCEKVRICLLHYLSFEYLCSINGKVHKVEKLPDKSLFDQDEFCVQAELFS